MSISHSLAQLEGIAERLIEAAQWEQLDTGNIAGKEILTIVASIREELQGGRWVTITGRGFDWNVRFHDSLQDAVDDMSWLADWIDVTLAKIIEAPTTPSG